MAEKIKKSLYVPDWIVEVLDREGENYDGPGVVAATSIHSFCSMPEKAKKEALKKYRAKECKSKHTLNKDISRLRAFLNWLAKRNYSTGKFDIELSKAPPVTVKALSTAQIRRLLKACPTPEWYVRTLLSLVTGPRASDIDNLNINMVDTTEMSVFVVEKKTSKPKTYPLPNKIKPILAKYLNGREKMFSSTNRSSLDKQWRKFRPEPITRQDLRRTNKTLLQKIGSIGSVQELLHSDLKVTTEYYTDQELILRWKVDQLPVKEWLSTLQ